ncbi:hypothetical protein DFR70_104513 [Nocardia tenerifensis]|uniref:Uncharacterized protein n=1 Tax=Nocardia tenerifensis TaxID=228006 RepID=A0A318K310_9NOCA|nr:hypothetical protein [Nocardia tenerifensis]PXX65449.1 hypothetical protein DFR70_104513 [Nocardia tenerifensis]
MPLQPELTQRDLRNESKEKLSPPRRKRRFVSREDFAAMSRNAPDIDLDAFRADQDAAVG